MKKRGRKHSGINWTFFIGNSAKQQRRHKWNVHEAWWSVEVTANDRIQTYLGPSALNLIVKIKLVALKVCAEGVKAAADSKGVQAATEEELA